MNIGDRVRLMSGREEGIITRLLDQQQIEVAIDNEFTIPLLRSDVVVISQAEVKAFGERPAPPIAPPPKPGSTPAGPPGGGSKGGMKATGPKGGGPTGKPALAALGAYLALTHEAEELLAVRLLNNADEELLYTYGEEKGDQYIGRKNGVLPAREGAVLAHLHLRDFETWPALVVQFLAHHPGNRQLQALETARVRFKAASFYGSRGAVPLLKGAEGYVYRLAEHRLVTAPILPPAPVGTTGPDPALAAALTAGMLTPKTAPNVKVTAPPHEVDLHLEKLADAPAGEVSNAEALRLQMAAFQDALDRAIATAMHEIVFIHGLGSGALRKEIHRALSRDRRIKFFEEAQKEQFGFGATRVRLK